jgi:hypothetical protein
MAALHSPDHALVFDNGMYYVQHYPSMEKRMLETFVLAIEPEDKWRSIWKAAQDALNHAPTASTASCTPHTRTSR